jgi:hypothetical protein
MTHSSFCRLLYIYVESGSNLPEHVPVDVIIRLRLHKCVCRRRYVIVVATLCFWSQVVIAVAPLYQCFALLIMQVPGAIRAIHHLRHSESQ